MTASAWPGYLALAALVCLTVGALFFSAAGLLALTTAIRNHRRGR